MPDNKDYRKFLEGKRGVKIKVVLRIAGAGKIHFWSVMKIGD